LEQTQLPIMERDFLSLGLAAKEQRYRSRQRHRRHKLRAVRLWY